MLQEARPLRRSSVWSAVAVSLGAACALAPACTPAPEPSTASPKPGPKAPASSSAAASAPASGVVRPPWPNMATAAWGQRVLEERAASRGGAPPAGDIKLGSVLDALHELDDGSERRALELALAWQHAARTNAERGTACALAGAALVLDPTVEGYKERLTDAVGLAAYAGTLDVADPVGQAARALVGAASGTVEQARRLVEVVETTPALGPEPRLFLGLARKLMGERSDGVVEHLRAALTARPGSARARAALAELWLELGIVEEARAALTGEGAGPVPWLDVLRARTLVLGGRAAEGAAALRQAEAKVPEGRRGDALYWLGLALAAGGAPAAEIEAAVASVGARPGFGKEAAVLQALLARRSDDRTRARSSLEPLMKGPPTLPVDTDAAWLLAEVCAAQGDLKCVDGASARAVGTDGDDARRHLLRASVAGQGQGAIDVDDELREAHRASPFDPSLARKVGEPVVPGGELAAARVRGARRALVKKGGSVVAQALGTLAQEPACRVCRALLAAGASGEAATARALAALEGRGPQLSASDLALVASALGATPTPAATKALEKLAADPRPVVMRAVAQARADHADPDARRRRDAGHGDGHAHDEGSPVRPRAPAGAPGKR